DYRVVEADSGSIGGNQSHEFHLLASSGEDIVVFNDEGNYAANIEKAEALSVLTSRNPPEVSLSLTDTPDVKTIEQLVELLALPVEKTAKTLIVAASDQSESDFIALMIRGDHTLNEIKAENLPEVAAPLRFATEAEIKTVTGASAGSLGPVNLSIPCIVDRTVAMMSDFSAGANIDGKHYTGINWERDASYLREEDLRNVVAGDQSPDGKGKLLMKRGIEAGHIFQLGKKYSDAMNATVLDVNGKAQTLYMGCYGLGVTRIVAAAIEQNHDDRGITWPAGMAPFQVALVGLKIEKSEQVQQVAETIYQQLTEAGIDVLLDDRKATPGVKLADMELIGIPHRIVISEKGLTNNTLEYKHRNATNTNNIAPEEVVAFLIQQCKVN
ncbi:MAG: proline--tRNA ligase, partial [Endozoicomonadaceae bacterium]|nr:proline--tRNA ligase [Endozoicomonadaceae bacterium]